MAKNFTICVGTLGMGLWRSADGGKSWARGKLWKGYQGGRSVFGLAAHPQDSRIIYAGADDGIYRSEDRGANFEHIESPLDAYNVWRINSVITSTRRSASPSSVEVTLATTRLWTQVCIFATAPGSMNLDAMLCRKPTFVQSRSS